MRRFWAITLLALPMAAHAARPATPAPLRLGLATDPAYARALAAAVLRPYARATRQPPPRIVPLVPATWDLTQLGPVATARACAAGTIARFDWHAPANQVLGGQARFLPQAISPCGVGAYLGRTVLAWDSARLPGTPGWSDFWDVARLPGKRGLYRGAVGTLEIALMADGVAPRDVYTVLRGKGGPDRAFRKLDQLRPYISWWTDDAAAIRLLATGAVRMTSASAGPLATSGSALHRSFGTQPAGSISWVQNWVVARDTQATPAAMALIAAATQPAAQATLAAATGSSPATRPNQGTAPMPDAVVFDADFWRDHQAELDARFKDWLAH